MYNKLDKEEKIKAKEKFFSTDQGLIIKKSFKRLFFFITILILYSISLYFFGDGQTYEKYIIVFCIISCFCIIFSMCNIYKKSINTFLDNKKK
ncbi:MAG: hypothetical protein R3Y13_00205 [bacterium]